MLKSMLLLQKSLNDETNGLGWESGFTNRGKRINWRRCMWLEAAELVESYPWKHWKSIDATPNYDNIRIELVDIWHFVMSEALRVNTIEGSDNIIDIVNRMASTPEFKAFAKGNPPLRDIYKEIEIVESFVKALFTNESIEGLSARFFDMARLGNLDLISLYKLYVGKNILNRFRQNNGYKEGKYKKIWGDREDNAILQEILDSKPNIKPDSLYQELERVYREVVN